MGAPFQSTVTQLACATAPGGNGPVSTIITCNAGAAPSQSASPSAAPSVGATVSVGASASRTASATPSKSAVAATIVQPMVLVTTQFDGADCSPSAVTSVQSQPNACFPGASGGSMGAISSFTWTCVNSSYATKTTYSNSACAASGAAGAAPVTVPVAGVGKCQAGTNGNAVTSSFVSCAPGTFAQPALSAVIAIYKPTDTCTSLSITPALYITQPLGCAARLGGAYSTLASCNATAASLTNYNGNTCSTPNGTGNVAYPLNACLTGTGIGGTGAPVKITCNSVAGATTSPAPSHTPSPTPSLSVGASPSVTPSATPAAVTASPSASLAFHPSLSIPPPPAGFREDNVFAPSDPTTHLPLVGLEVPAGPHADIFCPTCPLPPAGVSLFMSALVYAEIPASVDAGFVRATLLQMAWTKTGGLMQLPAAEVANTTVTKSADDTWFSVSNVPCRTPSNPGGACALQIAVTYPSANGGVGELPFRVWYKTYSNAALPAAAAAPSAALPLGAGVGGGVGAVLVLCLLLHWARVLTVPCFNVCCDHHKAGLAKAKDRRSFGEVVTSEWDAGGGGARAGAEVGGGERRARVSRACEECERVRARVLHSPARALAATLLTPPHPASCTHIHTVEAHHTSRQGRRLHTTALPPSPAHTWPLWKPSTSYST